MPTPQNPDQKAATILPFPRQARFAAQAAHTPIDGPISLSSAAEARAVRGAKTIDDALARLDALRAEASRDLGQCLTARDIADEIVAIRKTRLWVKRRLRAHLMSNNTAKALQAAVDMSILDDDLARLTRLAHEIRFEAGRGAVIDRFTAPDTEANTGAATEEGPGA